MASNMQSTRWGEAEWAEYLHMTGQNQQGDSQEILLKENTGCF